MPASIGVNLRVTGHCRQGGRKYMEDFFSVAYQQTEDERDLEYAFFGIYDGHGGAEAAAYAKEHLMELIVRQKNFWSDNDEDVLKAIKEGYIATHYAMWREQAKWPKTASGLPSTAGTTASIAFIRRGKIYIGHVGDSGIVLGYQESDSSDWLAKPLTKDHKPESAGEIQRIEQCGGKVVSKSGVPRVVWNRPRLGHQGPIRRSTPIDEIPFLAVARSLGDLWSYNSQLDEFVVSPDPDCTVIPIDTNTFRCLIFGTDGLYNMLSPQMAVHIVQQAEKHNENAALSDDHNKIWINPSKCLVEKALERWSTTKMRADNTSVITLLLDPPGPPRAQVLQNRKRKAYPDSGLEILTRYEGEVPTSPKRSCINSNHNKQIDKNIQVDLQEKVPDESMFSASEILRKMSAEYTIKNSPILHNIMQNKHTDPASSTEHTDKLMCETGTNTEDLDKNFIPKTRESTSYDVQDVNKSYSECGKSDVDNLVTKKQSKNDETVQIHEISSSSSDIDEERTLHSHQVETKAKSAKHAKKNTEPPERPVLRSRNSKNIAEQKKIPVKVAKNQAKAYNKQKKNRSHKNDAHLETENNINTSRQLRVRNSTKESILKQDQNRNVTSTKSAPSSKPGTSSDTKIEWLNVVMFRNIIKNKTINAKKLKSNTLKIRGRLKDGVQTKKDKEKAEDNVRRSSRHTSVVLNNSEKKADAKGKKDTIVVKRGRGRPQGSKNKVKPPAVPRSSRLAYGMLRQGLQR